MTLEILNTLQVHNHHHHHHRRPLTIFIFRTVSSMERLESPRSAPWSPSTDPLMHINTRDSEQAAFLNNERVTSLLVQLQESHAQLHTRMVSAGMRLAGWLAGWLVSCTHCYSELSHVLCVVIRGWSSLAVLHCFTLSRWTIFADVSPTKAKDVAIRLFKANLCSGNLQFEGLYVVLAGCQSVC